MSDSGRLWGANADLELPKPVREAINELAGIAATAHCHAEHCKQLDRPETARLFQAIDDKIMAAVRKLKKESR